VRYDCSTLKDHPELWDRYTRAEEYGPVFVDQYERFRSFSSRDGHPTEPSVSAHLIAENGTCRWPEGRTFAMCLTHDIDFVRYSMLKSGFHALTALRQGDVGTAWRQGTGWLGRNRSPVWNFQAIMDLEAQYGAKSTFYFLALEPGEKDFNFRISDVKDVIRDIDQRGWEVGLHGGHTAWCDSVALGREKGRLEDALGNSIVGYRNHYLRFNIPDTWRLLADAGFEYDSSVGWPGMIGFRNGMCHPYQPYDRRTDEFMDIVEIPLVIMDRTFDRYLGISDDKAWELSKTILDRVAELGGVATVLWHNTDFEGSRRDLYERFLAYGSERNAWMTPARDIARWWKYPESESDVG
jgi:peptidoglycan/xylan/chitin deacetylase (PgdA/CDA1 family)